MATNVAPNDSVDGRDASKGDEILLNDSTSGKLGRASKDDPATMAASEGIRHASISDHAESVAGENRAVAASTNTTTTTSVVDAGPGSKSAEHTREATPQTTDDTRLVEKVASPGKKRGRDQEDEDESAGEEPSAPRQCSSSPEGHTSKSGRNGREKKRHRDASIEPTKDRDEEQVIEEKSTVTPSTKSDAEEKQVTKETPVTSEPPPENPSDTFKKSAFGALAASTTSPFGTIGADKPSVFGGGASKQASVFSAGSAAQTSSFGGAKASGSGFGAFSGDKPLNGFGSTFGSSGPSAFGGAGSGTFGSVLATGFGSAGGTKLSSFAAPDKSSTSHETKPAKAFGAPESDAEDSEDDEKDSGADPEVNPEEEGEGKTPSEDKKLKFAKGAPSHVPLYGDLNS